MGLIDEEAASKGFAPSVHMDQRLANTSYYHGESAIARVVSNRTPSGKTRSLDRRKWGTIARLVSKARRMNVTVTD